MHVLCDVCYVYVYDFTIRHTLGFIIAMLFTTLSHAAKAVKAGTIIGEQKPVT